MKVILLEDVKALGKKERAGKPCRIVRWSVSTCPRRL